MPFNSNCMEQSWPARRNKPVRKRGKRGNLLPSWSTVCSTPLMPFFWCVCYFCLPYREGSLLNSMTQPTCYHRPSLQIATQLTLVLIQMSKSLFPLSKQNTLHSLSQRLVIYSNVEIIRTETQFSIYKWKFDRH